MLIRTFFHFVKKKNVATKKMAKQKKRRRFWIYILGGDVLRFLEKQTKMIVLIVILLVFYISNRYTCIMKLREIDRLQIQLKEVQSESVSTLVKLNENMQPSGVEERVKRLGIGLEKAKIPPYKLQK